MYLIDTNIFLEMLLDQQRADECENLVARLYAGEISAYVSSFTMHSIEVILKDDRSPESLPEGHQRSEGAEKNRHVNIGRAVHGSADEHDRR